MTRRLFDSWSILLTWTLIVALFNFTTHAAGMAKSSKLNLVLEAVQRTGQADRYVSEFDAATDQPLKKNIQPQAPNLYKVPKDTIMYHATPNHFAAFYERPTWFSMDAKEGFTLAVGNVEDKPVKLYVRRVKASRDLNLFLMKRTEAESKTALMNLQTSSGVRPWRAARFQVQYALKSDGYPILPKQLTGARKPLTDAGLVWYAQKSRNAPLPEQFIRAFCAIMPQLGYDGWRNPWDQDEVMLCAKTTENVPEEIGTTIESKVTMFGGLVCPVSKWQPVISMYGSETDTLHKIIPMQDAKGGLIQRMHAIAVSKAVANSIKTGVLRPVTFDVLQANDSTQDALDASCCDAPDARWRAWERLDELVQLMLRNTARARVTGVTEEEKEQLRQSTAAASGEKHMQRNIAKVMVNKTILP